MLDLRQNESESFPENQDDSSDAVHQGLGLAMANFIVQGSVLRDGDVIGLGDGRAVYHTVTTLPGPGCLKQLNASVVSLSGFTPSGGAFRTKNTAMDADINVALLGPAFANPVRLELMTHPLVYPDSEVSMRVRNNTWLWDASRPGLHPTVALVGIGTFGKGHRLYEFARHAAASLSMVPAGSALEELADLCEPFQASPYSPVADIANCLFFVKPPKSIVVPAVRVERIRHLIDQVNDTLHTISWSAIKKIPLVLLIAGTLKKAYAIRAILQLMPTNIRAICTNHQTAGLLLSER